MRKKVEYTVFPYLISTRSQDKSPNDLEVQNKKFNGQFGVFEGFGF